MPEKSARKIATIDIGSNSIVLLIALSFPDGSIEFLDEHYALTKLGSDVKAKKELSDDAIEHTIAAIKELKSLAIEEGVEEIILTTSSAVRMAENRNRFLVKCFKEIGIFPQVLSGKEEAKYTFMGALTDVVTNRPLITVDVGGGSTEVSWGTPDEMVNGYSLDAGCVSLKEEFNLGEGYYLYRRIAASLYLKREFAKIANELTTWLDGNKPTVILTGGTITTYASLQLKKDIYDRKKIDLIKGKRKELALTSRKIARLDIKSRKRVPGMVLDRVYDLPAGLLICTEFLKYFQIKRFLISSNGLRAGVLKNYAKKYLG